MSQEHSASEPMHTQQASYWPIVLAATLTVAIMGLIMHPAVTMTGGLLSLVAMIAWGVERFHNPAVETVHLPQERFGLPAVAPGEAEAEMPVEIGRSPNWWGMVWFIATEATFFAFMIAGYIYLRASSQAWPPPGTPHVELLVPSVNTVILLLSGVPAYLGHKAIKNGDQRGLQVGLALAALLGAIFLGVQVYEYVTAGFTPQTNIFGAGFFVLTGFHGAHVLAGIGLLLVTLVRSMRGHFSREHHFGVEFTSTYWHFVDAVWVFLFVLLYVAR